MKHKGIKLEVAEGLKVINYRLRNVPPVSFIRLDGFRYFIAVAESGSLMEAAKKLGSNQSTVARQINAFETTLDIKLFQRSDDGLLLTEEGVFVYEQSQSN